MTDERERAALERAGRRAWASVTWAELSERPALHVVRLADELTPEPWWPWHRVIGGVVLRIRRARAAVTCCCCPVAHCIKAGELLVEVQTPEGVVPICALCAPRP